MSSNPKNRSQTTSLPLSRHEVGFIACKKRETGIEVRELRWNWLRIRQLLDEVFPLSTEWQTTDSTRANNDILSLAKQLYPYLPNGKGALRAIRDNSRRYAKMADRSRKKEAREALKPYRWQIDALVLAAGQKLAAIFCEANRQNWDPRAYQFFQELQLNLGKIRRLHFVTLTFSGNPTYKEVRKLLKDFTGNHLYRGGFESVEVVAFHPDSDNPGRLHVHLLIWSKYQNRSLQSQKNAIDDIRKAVARAKRGVGFTDYKAVTGVAEILKVSAYMALNYSRTLKQTKGDNNPIPKGARVISPPQNCLPGKTWVKVRKTTLVTPAKTAWRKAVSRYAEASERTTEGDRRWIWRERRLIREFLEPEEWWESSFTGLDGFTYRVREPTQDYYGNEVYRVESEDGRSFYLMDEALEELAALQVVANALPKDNTLDFTTGKTANCYEMLGMYARMSKPVYFANTE